MDNPNIKLSIYFFLFNAKIRSFDLDGCIKNFTAFADEVCCATIDSEDDTLERLKKYESDLGSNRFKVIYCPDITTKNNRFDGLLKTRAMQACTNPIRIIADADEEFPFHQRPLWDQYAQAMLNESSIDGLMVPVVDLYGSRDYIRADRYFGQKFRMHKDTVFARGVPKFAELPNGLINTKLSDTTEPVNEKGELCKFAEFVRPEMLDPLTSHALNQVPFVIHAGFLSLENRAKIGREFWKNNWENRSGGKESVATTVDELKDVLTVKHNLNIN